MFCRNGPESHGVPAEFAHSRLEPLIEGDIVEKNVGVFELAVEALFKHRDCLVKPLNVTIPGQYDDGCLGLGADLKSALALGNCTFLGRATLGAISPAGSSWRTAAIKQKQMNRDENRQQEQKSWQLGADHASSRIRPNLEIGNTYH